MGHFLIYPALAVLLLANLAKFGVNLLWEKWGGWSRVLVAVALVFGFSIVITARIGAQGVAAQALDDQWIRFEKHQRQELYQQLAIIEESLALSPTHQDLLINASILACSLGEDIKCRTYREQAYYLNPTHPFFSRK